MKIRLKDVVYWCSLVAPIFDVLKGAWNAIVNIAVQDDIHRQEIQFSVDSTEYVNPVVATIKVKEKE